MTHEDEQEDRTDDRETEKHGRKERSDSPSENESSGASSASASDSESSGSETDVRARSASEDDQKDASEEDASDEENEGENEEAAQEEDAQREKSLKAMEDAIKDLREQIARLSAPSPDVQQAVVMQPGYVPGMMMPMMNRSGGAPEARAPVELPQNPVPHDRHSCATHVDSQVTSKVDVQRRKPVKR